MKILGAVQAVFSLHRRPENHCDFRRAEDRFLAGVRELCGRAAERKIQIFMQPHPRKWHATAKMMTDFIKRVDTENLVFALNTCHSAMMGEKLSGCARTAGSLLGMILISAPGADSLAQQYDSHLPVHASGMDLSAIAGAMKKVPVVLDADYSSWDDVYQDVRKVAELTGQ